MNKNGTHTVYVVVSGQTYRVTVEDLDARPIRAVVNGNTYEVQVPALDSARADAPASAAAIAQSTPAGTEAPTTASTTSEAAVNGASGDARGPIVVKAPMPGNIVQILVEPGEVVRFGQDLCVLEAMKMKNRLRAPGAGKVSAVYAYAGQTVQHGTRLVALEMETEE